MQFDNCICADVRFSGVESYATGWSGLIKFEARTPQLHPDRARRYD
jgi:hypothetical protein